MTEYAQSLLHQNQDRYQSQNFYKQSNFEQITKQLVNSFFSSQGYFYKVPNLLTTQPKSFLKEAINFFSPNSSFHNQLISHQKYQSQHFTAPLTDSNSYFHSIYAGCVASSLFGEFIHLLIECAKNARFSVRSDNFQLKNYRNGALLVLENWSKWDGEGLNSTGLQCISTGNGIRKIVVVKSSEIVSILCIQSILNDLESCHSTTCKCTNQNIESTDLESCNQFQANLYASNRNSVLEIFLSSNKASSDAIDYYTIQAAFYMLIQQQHFRHIVKLPIFLQLIKNMNILMKNSLGQQIFSLYYEQITAFLENFIFRIKRAYAVTSSGKAKFESPDQVYAKIPVMMLTCLDQIMIFADGWRQILNFEFFSKAYETKLILLEQLKNMQKLVENNPVNVVFKKYEASKLLTDYRQDDIWVTGQKVSHRIQQLFDNNITQVPVSVKEIKKLYQKSSNLNQLKSIYISAIISLIKPQLYSKEDKIITKRYVNFFNIAQIDYYVLNKFFGSKPPEMRESEAMRNSTYNSRLLASGVQNFNNQPSNLTESWLVVMDALKSHVFWTLVVIAAFAIGVCKNLVLWVLQ